MVYQIALLLLSFSCVEKNTSENKTQKSEFVSGSNTDTLKFTSGVGVIFQDSKGNYWFGSHKEGVCLFDGKSFRYFTIKEGLSDNQVHSIKEDTKGNIWFGDRDNGAWKYDGNTVTNYTEGLTNNFVFSFYKDNKGVFWVGLADGNVFKFDGEKFIN